MESKENFGWAQWQTGVYIIQNNHIFFPSPFFQNDIFSPKYRTNWGDVYIFSVKSFCLNSSPYYFFSLFFPLFSPFLFLFYSFFPLFSFPFIIFFPKNFKKGYGKDVYLLYLDPPCRRRCVG